MKTLSIMFFLSFGLITLGGNLTTLKTESKTPAQDTTSARIWRQRAEAAMKEAREQKAIAVKTVADLVDLKKKLAECQAKEREGKK